MLLVVDANVVFSALHAVGNCLDVFLLNRVFERFEFVSPSKQRPSLSVLPDQESGSFK